MASSFVKTSRETLPLVPLRDMVVFPHMMAPFIVGRETSVRALELALSGTRCAGTSATSA
jgi:ATP-dependent Lon protease